VRILITLLLLIPLQAIAAGHNLEYTLHKKESDRPGKTILVIGGIQGDEPGGFNAASLLVTHYNIKKGNVWVVPNLNFNSIINRSRGIYGDMNRKFASVLESDPDYQAIQNIKKLISDKQVDYVFNLHDGSGFYRGEYIDRLHSPYRWGQSIVIDQQVLDGHPLGNMEEVAHAIASKVNDNLLDREHAYRVKNTRTREGDMEMAKTLTYFAINQNKPAIGIEASKSLLTHQRAYYHLQVLEGYMDWLGLEYQRDFNMHASAIKETIDNNVKVSFYQNRIFMDMKNARKQLRYVPLREGSKIEFSASSPLVAITSRANGYRVSYGNRRVTDISPQYFRFDESLQSIPMNVDGQRKQVTPGSIVDVARAFRIEEMEGYRVNVIGWSKKKIKNESGLDIYRDEIAKRFSIDKQGTTFRVELYKGREFSGMVLVRFTDNSKTARASTPLNRNQQPG